MIDITFLKKTIVTIMFAIALVSNDIVKWNKQTHMHPAKNHTGHNLITSNLQFIFCTYIAQQSCHIINLHSLTRFCININLLTIMYIPNEFLEQLRWINYGQLRWINYGQLRWINYGQLRWINYSQLRTVQLINSQAGDKFQITSLRNTCNQFNMSHFFNSKQLFIHDLVNIISVLQCSIILYIDFKQSSRTSNKPSRINLHELRINLRINPAKKSNEQ